MARACLALVFALLAIAHSKKPGMDDLVSIGAGAEAASKAYAAAAAKLPSASAAQAAIAEANAKSAASLAADLEAEAAAAAAELPCPGCAHDYSALCPEGWSEGSTGVCTAPESYTTPCAAFAYFSAMSPADKARFEGRCAVCWPCAAASPVAPPSPNGPVAFTQVRSQGPEYPTLNLHVAEPNDAAAVQSLRATRTALRNKLASLESSQLASAEEMAKKMASATRQMSALVSSAEQANRGQSVSFLASKVLPVDAYKIRNSLYLTQSLRSPAQAAINIVSKEDVAKAQEEAKYKGMLAQTANIMKSIKTELTQISQNLAVAPAGRPQAAQLLDASQTATLKRAVSELVPRVEAGGHTAKKALANAIAMMSEPSAKTSMKASGLEAAAAKLMSRPSTSADTAALAGSLITLLSDMPVTSEVAEEKTGSYGHVNVVVPRPSRVYGADKALMELASGVAPSSI